MTLGGVPIKPEVLINMISAHSIAHRIRHPHRRPSQRRSHHIPGLRSPLRNPGRAGAPSDCQPEPDPIEQVILIPAKPRLFWPQPPPQGYLGQLDPIFQARIQAERSSVARDDCDFYHSVRLANGELIEGAWDLRGREDPYLGVTDFDRKRVLEFGPATGHLTFHMEAQGAEVVGFDIGWDCVPEVIPDKIEDAQPFANATLRAISAVQNSWWYTKRGTNSQAKMVYGDIYRLPADLGTFDISLFGCILPNLRDPWRALSEAASITRKRIIVTDVVRPEADAVSRNFMEHASTWAPDGREAWTSWWAMSPGAVLDCLRQLGFSRSRLMLHNQRHRPMGALFDVEEAGDSLSRWSEVPMYTVVAEREWGF
ncbi:MAG TPA: class I SAM-dependent methyltransferase [Acidimicrobiales bacterium]|nr:class I SAM-dependent methyltransferase [Acidimicrobiales bacterium]